MLTWTNVWFWILPKPLNDQIQSTPMNTSRLKCGIFYPAFLLFISHTLWHAWTLAQFKQPEYLAIPGAFTFSQSPLLFDREGVFTWKQSFEIIYPDRTLSMKDLDVYRKLSSLERHLFMLGDFPPTLSEARNEVVRYYFCDLKIQNSDLLAAPPLEIKWNLEDESSSRTIADVLCQN